MRRRRKWSGLGGASSAPTMSRSTYTSLSPLDPVGPPHLVLPYSKEPSSFSFPLALRIRLCARRYLPADRPPRHHHGPRTSLDPARTPVQDRRSGPGQRAQGLGLHVQRFSPSGALRQGPHAVESQLPRCVLTEAASSSLRNTRYLVRLNATGSQRTKLHYWREIDPRGSSTDRHPASHAATPYTVLRQCPGRYLVMHAG